MVAPDPCTIHDGLAVYRFGLGRPVLFMPGPHRFERPGLPVADALINGLVHAGHRVITFDPPGSGRSSRPARLGVAEMLECTDEALRIANAPTQVAALGHSMGGLALLAYALERPDRLSRMVLVGTGAGPLYLHAPGALWQRGHPGFAGVAVLGSLHLLLRRLATERLLNNFIHRRSFTDAALADTEPVEWADWWRPAQGRADWHRIARRLDYTLRLKEIGIAVLLLCGREDPQFPPACSQELAESITRARLIFFERSGHYPFLEEPDKFWAATTAFLTPAWEPSPRASTA